MNLSNRQRVGLERVNSGDWILVPDDVTNDLESIGLITEPGELGAREATDAGRWYLQGYDDGCEVTY